MFLLYSSARRVLPYAGVAVATGTAAVVAAPVVLSAVGFTATGVTVGSVAAFIQSVFYGGYVGSGSLFALTQSAGAAGIGAAGNTAIFGIGGTLGTGIFVCLVYNSFNFHDLYCLWACFIRYFHFD